jgi:hypothetical protein
MADHRTRGQEEQKQKLEPQRSLRGSAKAWIAELAEEGAENAERTEEK